MQPNMYHDPEVPAGFQDADLEMRELAQPREKQCPDCGRIPGDPIEWRYECCERNGIA